MENLYRQIRKMIAGKKFDDLCALSVVKPDRFNWVTEVFENIHVNDTPDARALIWTDGGTTKIFTFREMSILCDRLLHFLRKKGVRQHAFIYSQMALLPENWLITLAAIKGGFRLIPSATNLSIGDIAYRFGKLPPDAVIADKENAVKIDEAEAASGNPLRLKIIVNGTREGWLSLDSIKEIPQEAYDKEIAAETLANDPLFLFFTSGTTGMPKIVTQTHLSYPYGHLTTALWVGIKQGDIHYNISQPGWAKFAYSSFFSPWNVGATVFAFYQPGRFNAVNQLAMMAKFKVTTFCAPPTALRMLIQEDLSVYSLSLRECVAAGEPLNPEIIETWLKGTGVMIRDGYGQTESSIMVGNLPGQKIKYGSMGKPTFMYDITIADDDGNELPPYEEGSITVRTNTSKPNGLFTGYFGDPEKKKEVFKHDLYYTGDKAYRDDEGYIWFVGRNDDVIISSDYRVGPFEVESALLEHELVIESAVVSSPHALKGSIVKAFIILSAGSSPNQSTAESIFTFAKANLAAYKAPYIIEFVTELPKTISGKIRRVELRASEAESRLNRRKGKYEYFFL